MTNVSSECVGGATTSGLPFGGECFKGNSTRRTGTFPLGFNFKNSGVIYGKWEWFSEEIQRELWSMDELLVDDVVN